MKRVVARELMDDRVESIDELKGNLADIEFANRRFGGLAPVLREVRRCAARTLLDVCCGSGDIARALIRDAGRRGVQLNVTALDLSDQMLSIARERTSAAASVTFVRGDACALPFADSTFDIVTCNLALHHFEPDAAHAMLREIRRVARVAPLVCDLRRSRAAFVAAIVWSRLFSGNRLTRHDAPLSVRRAYTVDEVRTLTAIAGWSAPRVQAEPFFRLSVVDDVAGAAGEPAVRRR